MPDRWPQGDPVPKNPENDRRSEVTGFKGLYPGYHDVDASPSKDEVMAQAEGIYFELAFSKRPQYQLYDIAEDPYCIDNIADRKEYAEIVSELQETLMTDLKAQGDPRAFGNPIFDSYPRYSSMRNFKGFNERGAYNPAFKP
jgi:uncharacterized sulfatase